MENIMNTLPDNYISNETLWIYKENIEVFNKYNQQVIQNPIKIIKPKQQPPPKKEAEPSSKKEEEPSPKKEEEPSPKKEEEPSPKNKKSKIESPLDLIIRFTYVDKIMKQDIKTKLIEFISEPEFSKVFGMKKSSEIMTALTKDSWNQSISLFISFFLNKHIIYKEKSYSYYKNKEEPIITVS
jgi:hypothetical protein